MKLGYKIVILLVIIVVGISIYYFSSRESIDYDKAVNVVKHILRQKINITVKKMSHTFLTLS